MRDGYPGTSRHGGEKLSPDDCIKYIGPESWQILYSPEKNCFYLNSNEYHPGDLEISINDLEKMISFAKENMSK
jgi:hypothetical protein